MDFKEFRKVVLEEFPGLDEGQLAAFEAMEALYADWNSKINVISRKDIGELYRHHVLHSLCIASYLQRERPDMHQALADGRTVLDVGTGGGFPGIPLAVMYPASRFTLCDSVGKKIIVASAVAEALGLGNVETVHARAESLPGIFDYVVSRAVTSLDNFYPWVKGRYREAIFYLRGGDVAMETAQLAQSSGLDMGHMHPWPVDRWLEDEDFAGKYVIHIG